MAGSYATAANTGVRSAKKNQDAPFFNRISTRFAQVFHRGCVASRGTRIQLRFGRKVEPQVFGDPPNLFVEAADGSHVLLHQLQHPLVLRSRDTDRRIFRLVLIEFRSNPASIRQSGATIR